MEKPLDLLEPEKSVKRAARVVAMRRELNHLRGKASLDKFIVGKTQAMHDLIGERAPAELRSPR